jgi:hypothetical protein
MWRWRRIRRCRRATRGSAAGGRLGPGSRASTCRGSSSPPRSPDGGGQAGRQVNADPVARSECRGEGPQLIDGQVAVLGLGLVAPGLGIGEMLGTRPRCGARRESRAGCGARRAARRSAARCTASSEAGPAARRGPGTVGGKPPVVDEEPGQVVGEFAGRPGGGVDTEAARVMEAVPGLGAGVPGPSAWRRDSRRGHGCGRAGSRRRHP